MQNADQSEFMKFDAWPCMRCADKDQNCNEAQDCNHDGLDRLTSARLAKKFDLARVTGALKRVHRKSDGAIVPAPLLSTPQSAWQEQVLDGLQRRLGAAEVTGLAHARVHVGECASSRQKSEKAHCCERHQTCESSGAAGVAGGLASAGGPRTPMTLAVKRALRSSTIRLGWAASLRASMTV